MYHIPWKWTSVVFQLYLSKCKKTKAIAGTKSVYPAKIMEINQKVKNVTLLWPVNKLSFVISGN